MNRLKNLLGVFAFSLLILGLPNFVSAQWQNRDDDNYGRGTSGRNGGYNNSSLQSAINRLKNNSREFQRRLDRELDNSRYDGRNREDQINRLANDFKNAANRLENSFGNGRNMNKSSDEAQRVLSLGAQLEREMSRTRINSNIQRDWNPIRQDLRTISDAYGYNNNNRNYPNNQRGNSGDWRNRIPFPLPF